MASPPCPSCGAPSPAGAAFCYRCGQLMPQVVGVPGPPPPLGVAGPAGGWLYPGAPTSPSREFDLPALSRIEWGVIVNFVGALTAAILIYGVGPAYGVSIGLTGSGGIPTNGELNLLTAAAVLGIAVAIGSMFLMRTGFARLREADRGFQSPASLTRIGVIGLFLLLVGLPVLLAGLSALAVPQCLGTSTNSTLHPPSNLPASCTGSIDTVVAGLGVTLVGAILALIGYVGELLGLWRLGVRHHSDKIRIGTIVSIFIPFVGLPIVWLGCRDARRSIEIPR